MTTPTAHPMATAEVTRTLRRRTALLIATLAATVLVAAACSDDGDDAGSDDPPAATQPDTGAEPDGEPPDGESPDGATIEVTGFLFQPDILEVEVGTEVTWSNGDEVSHTASADDGEFDIDLAGSGAAGSHTFDEPGTYTYACLIHGSMTGTVEVG